MQTPIEILNKYWHYNEFRSPQDKIIDAILDKKDVFGLMPTGGGKSICFQVPGMILEGICLIISPLIALMKDQVNQLNQRNIKAIALTGGISVNETIVLLDNCQFGNYKFLYLSPERLQTPWVLNRIKNLPINLIAIDEAHCVSQWGHDFRPSYLKISVLKEYFKEIPFLALTASATQRVKEDVMLQLGIQNAVIFQKSFSRDNIAYMVVDCDNKILKIEQILKKYPQSSIIYVKHRKSCNEISVQLQNLGMSSTYYHGGLSTKEKDINMQLWMTDKAQVIVATNAFGMGIDKPTVKTVIHVNIPESLENYYQESGRVGRNGEKSYAILLTNESDIYISKRQFLYVLCDKTFLKQVFRKLCNHLMIAYGEGFNEQFQFNLNDFCLKYNLHVLKTYNAIQFLDQQGIITLSKEFSQKISMQFIINPKEVMRYVSLNRIDEPIISSIVRAYTGIYETQTAISLSEIAIKSYSDENSVDLLLKKLKDKKIIEYHAKNNDATVIFNEIREDDYTINKVSKYLEAQNKLKTEQFYEVLNFVTNTSNCKNILILNYFGETTTIKCGICSVCTKNQKKISDIKSINKLILNLLNTEDLNSKEMESITKYDFQEILLSIQNLLDNNKIIVLGNNKYSLKKL